MHELILLRHAEAHLRKPEQSENRNQRDDRIPPMSFVAVARLQIVAAENDD